MEMRRLASGREVKVLDKEIPIITTKCPEKWICVDLETRDTWILEDGHYRRPNPQEKKEAIKIIKRPRI